MSPIKFTIFTDLIVWDAQTVMIKTVSGKSISCSVTLDFVIDNNDKTQFNSMFVSTNLVGVKYYLDVKR